MFTVLTILLIIIFAAVIGIFYLLYWGLLFSAPWLPLSQTEVERVLKIAEIRPDDILYDLGSGDGRVVIAAAQKYFKIFAKGGSARLAGVSAKRAAGGKAVGIEVVWLWCLLSTIKTHLLKLNKLVKIKQGNIFKENISEATIVICYLLPEALEKLIPKFKQELRPGTKIISVNFQINEWPALEVDKPRPKDKPIYFYRLQAL